MNIVVVGCGALGSYYGARLSRSGQAVTFLLRSDYDVVRRDGLWVRSRDGDFRVHPHCVNDPVQAGIADLMIIGLKTTANQELARLLPPLVGPDTTLLTLQNGLGNEEAIARIVPAAQIMGGVAFVCLNRLQPGLVQHTDHGHIVIGEYQGTQAARTQAVADLFQAAGVPCAVTSNLLQTRWEKLVWNIPFNGLGVASSAGYEAVRTGDVTKISHPREACLTTDRLLADPRWADLLRQLMHEVVAAAQSLGLPLSAGLVGQNLDRTRTMGAYKSSTLLDFEKGLPMEVQSIFFEPLRQAHKAGVSTPALANLCRILDHLTQTS